MHLEKAFETLLEEMKLDTDVLERNIPLMTRIGLISTIRAQSLVRI